MLPATARDLQSRVSESDAIGFDIEITGLPMKCPARIAALAFSLFVAAMPLTRPVCQWSRAADG